MTNTIEFNLASILEEILSVKRRKKEEQAGGEFNFMIDRESVDFRVFISKVT